MWGMKILKSCWRCPWLLMSIKYVDKNSQKNYLLWPMMTFGLFTLSPSSSRTFAAEKSMLCLWVSSDTTVISQPPLKCSIKQVKSVWLWKMLCWCPLSQRLCHNLSSHWIWPNMNIPILINCIRSRCVHKKLNWDLSLVWTFFFNFWRLHLKPAFFICTGKLISFLKPESWQQGQLQPGATLSSPEDRNII